MGTTARQPIQPGKPADIHDDGDTVRRSVTIRLPIEEVRREFAVEGIPGQATFAQAPGELGTEVRVTAPAEAQGAIKELLNAWKSDDPGESLSTQLRKFKARLEAGEVATTKGQPSGREAKET